MSSPETKSPRDQIIIKGNDMLVSIPGVDAPVRVNPFDRPFSAEKFPPKIAATCNSVREEILRSTPAHQHQPRPLVQPTREVSPDKTPQRDFPARELGAK